MSRSAADPGLIEKPIATATGAGFIAYHALRTLENRIDGVVMTFADITVFRTLEAALLEKRASFGN